VIVEPKATPARRSRRSQRKGESGRVPLSRELVLARAIEVGDQEGLEAVSFRRLASDMNVTPMALYRYVRDKDDLLDAMSDMIVGRVDLASVAGAPGGWEGKLRVLLDAFRHLLQAHPVAIPLFTRRAGTTPNWLRTIEVGLGILREAGFPMREAVDLLRQINNRLAGLVTLEPAVAPSPIARPGRCRPSEPRYPTGPSTCGVPERHRGCPLPDPVRRPRALLPAWSGPACRRGEGSTGEVPPVAGCPELDPIDEVEIRVVHNGLGDF